MVNAPWAVCFRQEALWKEHTVFWLVFWALLSPFILMAWLVKILCWDLPWTVYALVVEMRRRR